MKNNNEEKKAGGNKNSGAGAPGKSTLPNNKIAGNPNVHQPGGHH